ncbi:MAG TPA: hypothetical protein VGJ88_01930 [Thermoanaerobaculia bacterium]
MKRLFSRNRNSEQRIAQSGRDDVATPIPTEREQPHTARPVRREADIPLDQLNQSYSPTQTSLKGPFRANGADQHRDQEFATGAGVDRWNDEDHYTNKSGDPRIGTHRRSYEPGERDTRAGKK